MPENREEKIQKLHEAGPLTNLIQKTLFTRFPLDNVSVLVTDNGNVAINGYAESKGAKEAILDLVSKMKNVGHVVDGIVIYENKLDINVEANGQKFVIKNLAELHVILNKFDTIEDVEYSLTGHGETSLTILLNKNKAFAMYLREEGDSGLTTLNYNDHGYKMQSFILANGQHDEYPMDYLVTKREAIEIMRYYLLTGKLSEGVDWREEDY